MPDQSPSPSAYPGFEVSGEGLKALHTEFGRLAHQMFEATRKSEQIAQTARQLQERLAPLMESSEQAAPDAPDGPTPIKAKKQG
jgi:hypothetical protein